MRDNTYEKLEESIIGDIEGGNTNQEDHSLTAEFLSPKEENKWDNVSKKEQIKKNEDAKS